MKNELCFTVVVLNLNKLLTIDFNKQKQVARAFEKCCAKTIQICKKEEI